MTNTAELLIPVDLIEAQQKKHEKAKLDIPLEYGVVIYTDGGATQINTINGKTFTAGYGIHGFVYANTPTKVGAGVNGYTVSNYGYILNGRIDSGVDYCSLYQLDDRGKKTPQQVQPVAYIEGLGGLFDSTNNVAEATAFLKSLDLIERVHQQLAITSVHFRLDSKYIIDQVLNRFNIINNQWRTSQNREIANKELWVEIFARLEELSILPITWTIEWVKGHSDFFGNIQADKLATAGQTAAKNGHSFDSVTVGPAQGYWSTRGAIDFDDNPALYMLVDTKWYYDPQMIHEKRSDDLIPIFMGNHEDASRVGQPDSDMTIGLALMKRVPKTFEVLTDIALSLDRVNHGFETNGMFFGLMNNILKPEFATSVEKYGNRFLVTKSQNKQIFTSDNKEILTRLDPAFIAYKQLDKFKGLHTILDRVVDNRLLETDCLCDITSDVYDVNIDKKGKEVWKCKLTNDPFFKVDIKGRRFNTDNVYEECSFDATLTYGITAPRRRVFSGIKDHRPKVFVLTTFEAYAGFRYFLIIQLPTGEYGIWTNWESNLRIFK